MTDTDTEQHSLAAAVAALGDEHAMRHPSLEEIAEQRRADVRERALDVISLDIELTQDDPNCLRRARGMLYALDIAGLQIVQKRPA